MKLKTGSEVKLASIQVITVPTFIDYLQKGLNLNSIISVDFTGSNGNPSYTSSLHYLNPKFN